MYNRYEGGKSVLKKVLGIILCGFLVLSLTGCRNSDSTDNTNQSSGNSAKEKFDASAIEDNISISEADVALDGTLVAIIKNGNDETVNIEVEAVFYDEDGNALGSDSDYLTIYNNQEMACNFYNTPTDYSDYEINIKAEENYYTNYSNQIEISNNDTGEQIVVQVTNNADNTIESVDVAVVFYSDGEIVGYNSAYEYDLRSGSTSTSNIYYPYDSDYNDVSFDEYSVYVSAYSYD